jgi:hypothetical protein
VIILDANKVLSVDEMAMLSGVEVSSTDKLVHAEQV